MMNFHVFPAGGLADAGATNSTVRLNKQTICILTMPDLRLLRYTKVNNEYVKPFFGKGRRVHYMESYDFEDGDVSYLHKDYASGQIFTNMPNLSAMNQQSYQIAEVLKRLNLAYNSEAVLSSTQSVADIHFNVEGVVKTFGLYTKKINRNVPVLGKKIRLLHGDIRPVRDEDDTGESFSIECLPFRELAASLGDSNLVTIAGEGHDWYMVPLAGCYDLFVGAIACSMKSVSIIPLDHGTNAPAASRQ
jgi:hypothetical protein